MEVHRISGREVGLAEQKQATHDLGRFKAWAAGGSFRITTSAIKSAASLGLGRDEIRFVIATMESSHCHKSMTSYDDDQEWQDVYYVPSKYGSLYVKFRSDVLTEFHLLSFKENTNV